LLAERWPAGRLQMIKAAGHALSEPGISRELVRLMKSVMQTRSRYGF
ncbi:MAG: prolyl aminopeptidase, partial [Pseudomonadota bacterium]